MKRGDKRGVSAVVATVLIILITVAAVAIIWTVIIPLVREGAEFEEGKIDLSIETSGGYTYWDVALSRACVQVKRGQDELGDDELKNIQVLFLIDGDTTTKYFGLANVPGKGEAKKWCFDLDKKPTSVKVAPVYSIDNEEVGDVTAEVGTLTDGTYAGDGSDVANGDDDTPTPLCTGTTGFCSQNHILMISEDLVPSCVPLSASLGQYYVKFLTGPYAGETMDIASVGEGDNFYLDELTCDCYLIVDSVSFEVWAVI